MKEIVKMYGGAVISGIVILLLFLLLFHTVTDDAGNRGIFSIAGACLPDGGSERTGSEFGVYGAEAEKEFPEIRYMGPGAVSVGTYDLVTLIGAEDYAGGAAPFRLLRMEAPDGTEIAGAEGMTAVSFPAPGIYTLEIRAKDGWNREQVKRIRIPVNR